MSAKKSLSTATSPTLGEENSGDRVTRIEALVDGNNVSISLNCRGKQGDLAVLRVTTGDEDSVEERPSLSGFFVTMVCIGAFGFSVYYILNKDNGPKNILP